MYQIIDVDRNNLELYRSYITEDVSENIGRTYFRAIVAVLDIDNEIAGCMVWVLKNVNKEADNESNIIFIKSKDETVFDEMMKGYEDRISAEKVVRSGVQLPLKDGKQLKGMLNDKGFSMKLTESNVIIVKLSELSHMPLMEKLRSRKLPVSITTLNMVNIRTFRRGITRSICEGRYGLCEDLESLGVRWFEDEVSSISIEDEAINGMFLFHLRPSGIVAVQLLVCLDNSYKKTLPNLMCQFILAMEGKYGPDTMIELDRHNEQSLLLSEKLLPRGFGIPVYEGSREEVGR